MSSEQVRPRHSGRLLGKDLEEEYIFFDEKGDRVHVLNGTAREIYLLCDGTRTTGEIATILTERFSVDEPTATTDVASLLEELVELELVTVE